MRGLIWSNEEIETLDNLLEKGYTIPQVSMEFVKKGYYRTVDSITRKICRDKINSDCFHSDIDKPPIIVPKHKITSVVAAQYLQLVKESIKEYSDNKKNRIISVPKSDKSQTMIFLFSDPHIGKKTKFNGEEVYNLSIAKDAIKRMTDNVVDTYNRHVKRDVETDEIILALDGDIIDGELIYQTQHSHIETNVVKQLLKATVDVWELIDVLANLDKNIPLRIICCRGNHGRVNDMVSEEANWDLALYYQLKFTADIAKRKNIYFEISDDEYIIFDVKGHKCMMRHELPKDCRSNASKHKFGGWAAQHNFDFAIGAHWHSIGLDEWNKKPVIYNGCVSGTDDLSERMGLSNEPLQWLFGVSKNRILTYMYRIDTK